MSDTTFVPGTVVASTWLNDANAAVYRAQSALVGSVNRTALSKFSDFISVKDFGAVGDNVTDDTAALQAAIDYGYANLKTVYVPSGQYICSNIVTYPATTLIGQGRQTTIFRCKAGTLGLWWDAATFGASKLTMYGLAWYGNDELGVTYGLRAGKFGGGGTQYGTEGVIADIWIRDLPNAIGLDVDGNVGILRDITIQSCFSGLTCIGSVQRGSNIIIVAPRNGGIGLKVSSGQWSGIFIEAPETGATPISLFRPANLSGVAISLDGVSVTTFTQLILIDAGAASQWSVVGLEISLGAGSFTTVFNQGGLGFNGARAATFGEYATQSSKIGTSVDARPVTQVISKAYSIDFTLIAAGATQDQTVTLTGAVSGMPVVIGFTNTGPFTGLRYEAFVSAADTITLRAYNSTGAGIDPGPQTFVFHSFVY